MIKRLRRRKASGAEAHWLPKKQIALLQLYDDGTLLEKANEATLLSGHGCWRRPGDGVTLWVTSSRTTQLRTSMRTLLTRALRELADKRKTLALLSLEFC